ncbi:MAG: hypothetical protein ACMUJM_20220 [bacterium]
MGSRVRAISQTIGIMISPASLIMFGNNIGMWCVSFLAGIILAMIALTFTAISYGKAWALFPAQEN